MTLLRRTIGRTVLSSVLTLALAATASAQESEGQAPAAIEPVAPASIVQQISFQGFVSTPAGLPIADGNYPITCKLYNVSAGGVALWTESRPAVPITRGIFQINLGSVTALALTLFTGSPLYLGVSVNGEAELPRTQLLASPFAFRAAEADHATTADTAADGVWTVSGSNIYRSSGNVGIGTTTPDTRLNVDAGTDVSLNSGTGYVVIGPSVSSEIAMDDNEIQARSGGAGALLSIQAAGGNLALATGGGKVGIGTSSPEIKFQVVGGTDAELPDGTGYLILGAESSTNVVFDNNEIQARNNAAASNLLFQVEGGDVGIGTTTPAAKLDVNGTARVDVLQIVGADLAESFETSQAIAPGSVVSIDPSGSGRLIPSSSAYDTRVAGIISGANRVKAGVCLNQDGMLPAGQNVALNGRVYALATASTGPIEPGDLLTTSDVPGHVMKATDATRAHGAIIGKAMSGLESGTGMVLVLVNLQ